MTALYQALMKEIDRHRERVGYSQASLEALVGLSEGHYSRMLRAGRPGGRQTDWDTLQAIAEALFHDAGLRIKIVPDHALPAEAGIPQKSYVLQNGYMLNRLNKFAPDGGRARMAELTPSQRWSLASRAARARWHKRRLTSTRDDE